MPPKRLCYCVQETVPLCLRDERDKSVPLVRKSPCFCDSVLLCFCASSTVPLHLMDCVSVFSFRETVLRCSLLWFYADGYKAVLKRQCLYRTLVLHGSRRKAKINQRVS